MKVFGCTMQGRYRGGLILVAANSIEEAFKVASQSQFSYWFEDTEDGVTTSSFYPFEYWMEFSELSCTYTEPQVIIEASHAE